MKLARARQVVVLMLLAAGTAVAQKKPAPAPAANDSLNNPQIPVAPSTTPQSKETALDITTVPDPADSSAESSPVPPERRGASIHVGTVLSVQLSAAVDSGSAKNGDSFHGTLSTPVKISTGATLPVGTRVDGTVVASAKAGTVQSAGELSLQLLRVGGVPVVTDVDEFNGQEGHKDVADAAPQKGTEAQVQPGTALQFHVMENGPVPGIVKGASLDQINGGRTVGSPNNQGGGAQQPTGQPNTQPGANQRPIPGAGTQPTNSTPPR